MSLKLLVNKSVIKSDLRRYWWLGILFAGMIFLTGTLVARAEVMNSYPRWAEDTEFVGSRFAGTMNLSLFVMIVFSVIIPAMLFSYLHHRSAVTEVHSLPITRGGLYVSHLISVFALIFAAIAVNTLLMLTMVKVSAAFILTWALLSLVYCFVIASFSSAASMLVANTAAGVILPGIIMLLPLFAVGMLQVLCENYLHGYSSSNVFECLEWIYLDYGKLLRGGVFAYIAAGAVFLALGCVFYKKRALENNSRILAFDSLNPVFMYGLAMCAGLAGYAYINMMTNYGASAVKTMWIGVPFGIAGIIIARMIIAKTFRPSGVIKPVTVYLLMMCALYLFFGFDITGFEKRVPDINDIESVDTINMYYSQSGSMYAGNGKGESVIISESAQPDCKLYDKADIEKVLALHSILTEKEDGDIANYSVPIAYKLKNGRVMRRMYRADRMDAEVFENYCALEETIPVKMNRFPCLWEKEPRYTEMAVSCLGANKATLDDERIKKLNDALKKDITAAKFTDYEQEFSITQIDVSYKLPSEETDGTPITDPDRWGLSGCVYKVHKSYKNTIALLTEWGVYDKMPSADDISEIKVYDYIGGDAPSAREIRTVTDKAEIGEILGFIVECSKREDLAESMANQWSNVEICYKDGGIVGSVRLPLIGK